MAELVWPASHSSHGTESPSSAPSKATKKMGSRKILMLVSHFPAGGVQNIISDIATGLASSDTQIKLVALYPLIDTHSGEETEWSWLAQTKPRSFLDMARLLKSLIDLLRQYAPDAVISAMPAANIAAAFGGAIAAPRARIIMTHHSPVQTHNRIFDKVDSWLGSRKNVYKIVSVSNAVQHSLKEKPSAYLGKCITIHNALPPRIEQYLAALVSKRDGRYSAPRTAIATGRLSHQKNYPVLLRAAVHLPNVRFIILGGGEDEKVLKELAHTLGVEDRVDFLGARPRDDALALLASGGVFVQPSLFEGHSLALVEAAKLHLPLIVSNVPEQVEAVTLGNGLQCGICVDPSDHLALADAISKVLDDPDSNRLWRERSKLLGDSLRFESMIADYENLLA